MSDDVAEGRPCAMRHLDGACPLDRWVRVGALTARRPYVLENPSRGATCVTISRGLAAADAVDPPEVIADAQRQPESLPTLQPIDPLYAASAELHEIASALQLAGHGTAASIVLRAHRDVDALRDAADPPVRDGAPREIESPEAMGARLVPSLAFRDHARHMDWVRTLRDTIRVRDEQIAAWCEQHGFAAGREGDEQMTAYDLSTVDSNGMSNTALRDIAMYCEGQASTFRAVAAKLREVGR